MASSPAGLLLISWLQVCNGHGPQPGLGEKGLGRGWDPTSPHPDYGPRSHQPSPAQLATYAEWKEAWAQQLCVGRTQGTGPAEGPEQRGMACFSASPCLSLAGTGGGACPGPPQPPVTVTASARAPLVRMNPTGARLGRALAQARGDCGVPSPKGRQTSPNPGLLSSPTCSSQPPSSSLSLLSPALSLKPHRSPTLSQVCPPSPISLTPGSGFSLPVPLGHPDCPPQGPAAG